MVYLGRYNKPLVDECFEAWSYGPVLPSVYHRLKLFGDRSIKDRFYKVDIISGTEESNILADAWNALGNKDGWKLVGMTHRAEGAWSKNFEPGFNKLISNYDIKKEYDTVMGTCNSYAT
jgi:uncharacterized phage-associated protein